MQPRHSQPKLRVAVPLYLYPFHPLPQVQQAYYAGLPDAVVAQFSLAGWGWHHEAGIHLLRMILAGIFEQFPALQVISGHWGELVPFYLSRLDMAMPTAVTGLSKTILAEAGATSWVQRRPASARHTMTSFRRDVRRQRAVPAHPSPAR